MVVVGVGQEHGVQLFNAQALQGSPDAAHGAGLARVDQAHPVAGLQYQRVALAHVDGEQPNRRTAALGAAATQQRRDEQQRQHAKDAFHGIHLRFSFTVFLLFCSTIAPL